MPVHAGLHWSLVIICHAGALPPPTAAADHEIIDIDGTPASEPPQAVNPEPASLLAEGDVKAAAPCAPDEPALMDVDAAAKPVADDIAAVPAAAAEPPPAAAPELSPFILHLDSLSGGHSPGAFDWALQRASPF